MSETTTDEALKDLSDYLTETLGGQIASAVIAYGELTLNVEGEHLLAVTRFLRDDSRCRFVNLVDVCGVDWPARLRRFDSVVHLLSPTQNLRIRLKTETDEFTPIPSLTGLFPGADWFERESYDLLGILYSDHPDLRRLLTDYGFEGHPLRRDFPVTGFVELRYDDERKRVVYEPVRLNQEFRTFDFLSPWEGPHYVLPGDEKAKAN